MNMCTLAVTEEEYRKIIWTLEHGYTTDLKDKGGNIKGHIIHRPNHRVAMAAKLEYATGMRISDIVRMRQKDIVKDGNRYRLDLTEKKTGKKRTFRISNAVYDCIDDYCAKHKIPSSEPIIGTSTYAIQKQLKYVSEYLGIERFNSHALRKSAGLRVYELSGKDIVATQIFFQHASSATTSKYLASCGNVLDSVLEQMAM